jgi:hypothetical protein
MLWGSSDWVARKFNTIALNSATQRCDGADARDKCLEKLLRKYEQEIARFPPSINTTPSKLAKLCVDRLISGETLFFPDKTKSTIEHYVRQTGDVHRYAQFLVSDMSVPHDKKTVSKLAKAGKLDQLTDCLTTMGAYRIAFEIISETGKPIEALDYGVAHDATGTYTLACTALLALRDIEPSHPSIRRYIRTVASSPYAIDIYSAAMMLATTPKSRPVANELFETCFQCAEKVEDWNLAANSCISLEENGFDESKLGKMKLLLPIGALDDARVNYINTNQHVLIPAD